MAFKVSSGGKRGSRGRHKVGTEINITPLVDVMLVLLVIFMATTPMMTAGVAVDVPTSDATTIHEDDQGPIEIALTSTGQMYVGETPVNSDRLIELLTAMTKDTPDRRLFLRADKSLNYGDVMTTLGMLNAAGFAKIALITQQGVTAPK
jgi:biopolymer transport protein TolR